MLRSRRGDRRSSGRSQFFYSLDRHVDPLMLWEGLVDQVELVPGKSVYHVVKEKERNPLQRGHVKGIGSSVGMQLCIGGEESS